MDQKHASRKRQRINRPESHAGGSVAENAKKRSASGAEHFSKNRNGSGKNRPAAARSLGAEQVRIGDVVIVTIKRLGINGEGVGYYRRKAVFIGGALPDEVVKAKITRVEPNLLHGALLQIEKRSPYRIKPACPVYDACGGCQLQHFAYEGQLQAKQELVREAFERYAGVKDLPIRPIIGMAHPWGYRNKAQLQVGIDQGRVVTGLYSPGTHRLVDIAGCPIQHPGINRIIDRVKEIVRALEIPIYRERSNPGRGAQGMLRTVVVRTAVSTDEIQLTFVTVSEELPRNRELVASIRRDLPNVTTIAQNINPRHTSLVFGERTIVLWGKEHLDIQLGPLTFALSPRAFFQLNPEQTVKLYEAAREAAALTGRELVVDAYCGSGTIGLWLAPYAKEVRGIEILPEAVEDARRNAERNGIGNASFHAGRSEDLLPAWAKQDLRPDVIVVDPPRTGCDAKLLEAIVRTKPQRLVYVSCNPATLAKDCRKLLDSGYRIEWAQPVDMFPQTAHVECVVSTHRID